MIKVLMLLGLATSAFAFPRAFNAASEKYNDVGWEQRLGARLPLVARLRDESGREQALGTWLGGKPALVVLAYYGCPNLCTQVLNGLAEGLRERPAGLRDLGAKFNVLTLSIDPREGPELAREKKRSYLARYARADGEKGWHFLTASEPEIQRVASALGFHYRYDRRSDQYVHPAGLAVVTGEGRVSRYFLGVRFGGAELSTALSEAGHGRLGRLSDAVLLLCYHYDAALSRYGVTVERTLRVLGVVTLGLLALLISRLVKAAPGAMLGAIWSFPLGPGSASTVAPKVDALALTLTVVLGLVLAAVFGLIVYFCARYHSGQVVDRSNANAQHPLLEVAWIVTPLVFFMGIFAWGAWVYFDMNTPPPEAEEVYLVAKQWMWKFQHQDGFREINELHVPVGRPIRLTMTSEDVIHSFFVPDFRIKHDILPDRYMTTWFQATRPGSFRLFCTQYCGTAHSLMTGRIIVMSPGDYSAWLARTRAGGGRPGQPDALSAQPTRGRELFRSLGCIACHGPGGEGGKLAPQLQGLYGKRVALSTGTDVIADDDYLRESILYPGAKIVAGMNNIMPSFKGRISEQEVVDLISYIKSLKHGQRTSPTEGKP